MKNKYQSGGLPSKKLPANRRPKAKDLRPTRKNKGQSMSDFLKSKKSKDIGIEDSKVIKFGAPKKPRVKAQMSRWADRAIDNKNRDAGIKNDKYDDKGFRQGKSSGSSGSSTTRPAAQTSTKPKKNPYSDAKAKDANLDSYIRTRNAAKKGSSEYNEAQNKINRAYGKGPVRKVDPIKRVEPKKAAQVENKSAPKPTLKTRPTPKPAAKPTPAAKAPTKKETRQTARTKKTQVKEMARGLGMSKGQSNAAGRLAKAKAKGKEGKVDRMSNRFGKATERRGEKRNRADKRDQIKAIRKSQMGGPRKKAFLGVAKQVANVVGKIAPEGSKVGKLAQGASQIMENPLKAGLNAIQGKPIGGGAAAPAPAADPAAAAAAAPPPGATGQPVDPNLNQRNGGMKKKKQMGGMKKKPTSLKDRRKRGGRR